MQSERNTQAEI
jgi:hypothetical protein